MAINKTLFSCHEGTSLVLMAVMFPVMLATMGVAIDIARLFAVQSKAQGASDAALLGAVSTQSTDPAIQNEFLAQFNANYPANYMSSQVTINTITTSSGVSTATLNVTVPTVIMGYFGSNSSTLSVLSQVTSGFSNSQNQNLEITFVMDSSQTMALKNTAVTVTKEEEMKADALSLLNSFAVNGSIPANVHASLVPYDIVVDVGTGRDSWVQTSTPSCTASAPWSYECAGVIWMSDAEKYQHIGQIDGSDDYLSNRNSDYHAGFYNDNFNDVDDSPPTTEATKFRLPNANVVYDRYGTNSAAVWPFWPAYVFADSYITAAYTGPPTYSAYSNPNPGALAPPIINGTQYEPGDPLYYPGPKYYAQGDATFYKIGSGGTWATSQNTTYGDIAACYFWDIGLSGFNSGNLAFMNLPDPDPNPATLTGLAVSNLSGEVVAPANPYPGSPYSGSNAQYGTYLFKVTKPAAYLNTQIYISYSTRNGSSFNATPAIGGADFVGATNAVVLIPAGVPSILLAVSLVPQSNRFMSSDVTDLNFTFNLTGAVTPQNVPVPIAVITATGYIKPNYSAYGFTAPVSPHRDCLNLSPEPAKMVFGNVSTVQSSLAPSNPNYLPYTINFSSNVLSNLSSHTNPTNNYTRVNVGLMWGWFTLSSKWQGVWDGSALPATQSSSNPVRKVLVLMGDNVNSVYNATTSYNSIPTSNDDATARALCDAIKASPDQIEIWAVSPSSSPAANNPLLAYCATDANHYIHTTTQAATKTAVLGIANYVLYDTIRLSQ